MKNLKIILLILLSFGNNAFSQEKADCIAKRTKSIERKNLLYNIEKIAIPIDRESDDFSDLQFLKEYISDKRFVFLGEDRHGINDNNVIKYRLIRFLNQELGFNVVFFESGFGECCLTNLVKDSLTGMQMLVYSLIGFWRVTTNCEMFDYIRDNKMNFAGIDPNSKAIYLNKSYYNFLIPDNYILADKLFLADSCLLYYTLDKSNYFHTKITNETKKHELDSIKNYLIDLYSDISNNLKEYSLEMLNFKIINKYIEIKLFELQNTNNDLKDVEEYFVTNERRDSMMAKNLEFLADSIYPNEKIIVWAANYHIRKESGVKSKNICEYLNTKIKEESFVIGLYAKGGSSNEGGEFKLTKFKKNSLESILYQTNYPTLYLPIDSLVFNQPIRHGSRKKKSKLYKMYDGIIFMRDVKPSKLIPYNKEFKCM